MQTVEPWTPPETFEGVTDDAITRILDEIDAAYRTEPSTAAANAAKETSGLGASCKNTFRRSPRNSARHHQGLAQKQGTNDLCLDENPATRKDVKGLKVDKTKRPDVL